jgi:hypothetical protein
MVTTIECSCPNAVMDVLFDGARVLVKAKLSDAGANHGRETFGGAAEMNKNYHK